MKYCFLGLCVVACALCGCTSTPVNIQPADTTVSVVVQDDKALEEAIIKAATRRRWVPSRQENGVIRCTLTQRQSLVIIDIKPSNGQYEIHCVSCNVSQRKYEQWVNNLTREIAKWSATK